MNFRNYISSFYFSQKRKRKLKMPENVWSRQPIEFTHRVWLKCRLVYLHASVGKLREQSETPAFSGHDTSIWMSEKGTPKFFVILARPPHFLLLSALRFTTTIWLSTTRTNLTMSVLACLCHHKQPRTPWSVLISVWLHKAFTSSHPCHIFI